MFFMNCWISKLQRCYLTRLKKLHSQAIIIICGSSVMRKEDGIFLQCKYSCSNRALTSECRDKIPRLFILKEKHKIEEVKDVFRMNSKDGSGGCHDLNEA